MSDLEISKTLLRKQEILDEAGCCERIRFIVELIFLQSVKDNIESLERTAWETYKSLFLKKTTLFQRTDTLSH